MNRAIVVLAGLLAVQVGALVIRDQLGDDGGSAASAERGSRLLGFHADQVGSLVIRDAQGKELSLARREGGWVVASAGGFPADKRAHELLDKLVGLTIEGLSGRAADSHAKFEVKPGSAQREISFLDASGGVLAKLYLGRSSGRGQFVRLDGKDEVYRVGEALTWSAATSASAFVDTQLCDFKADEVTRLAWARGGEDTLVLERFTQEGATEPEWRILTPVPAKADKAKVDAAVRSFSTLRLTEPVAGQVAPEHGLTPPEVLLTATLTSGEKIVLEVGKPKDAAAGSQYARLRGKPFVVELSKWTLEGLLKDDKHFAAPPPAEEPKGLLERIPGVGGLLNPEGSTPPPAPAPGTATGEPKPGEAPKPEAPAQPEAPKPEEAPKPAEPKPADAPKPAPAPAPPPPGASGASGGAATSTPASPPG